LLVGAGNATVAIATLAADNTGETPATGGLDIAVAGTLEVNAGRIQSNAFGSGASGGVRVDAKDLAITQQGTDTLTGLFSEVEPGSQGDSGGVVVNLSGVLTMRGVVAINASSYGDGTAGHIAVRTNSIDIDGEGATVPYRSIDYIAGIASEAGKESSSNGGNIMVEAADRILLINSGGVSASTIGAGDAGYVEVTARELVLDGGGTGAFTGITNIAAPGSSRNAGKITIRAVDLLEVLNGGQILSSTFGAGHAGDIEIEAGRLRVDGQGNFLTLITSSAWAGSSGTAGMVTIRVANPLEVLNGGVISSDTDGSGDAGGVSIEAGRLCIDEKGGRYETGISSDAHSGSLGKAGTVTIIVADLMEVLNGGAISSDTYALKDAGGIEISAERLLIAGKGVPTGISTSTSKGSSGNAGTITLKVRGLMEIASGGAIMSSTFATGDAGGVEIEAGNLRVDGKGGLATIANITALSSSDAGNAGTVTVTVPGLMEVLNGGIISTGTYGSGNAGDVEIEAGYLRVEGQGAKDFTMVTSSAEENSTGTAGTVTIRVTDFLEVLNGGQISSSTFADGNAGSVKIQAGELLIDGQDAPGVTFIASGAGKSAQGFAGDVEIEAGKMTAQNGGGVTVQTDQTVSEEKRSQTINSHLFIDSPLVILLNTGIITAHSTGNVGAAAIDINADEILISSNSRVTTSAQEADGGSITLRGDIIDLRDSFITSSVTGETGNGGDITIKGNSPAKALIVEGGFIQANAPAGARGGDIYIDTEAVIPAGGALEVGGLIRQNFEAGSGRNIIQAAAPGGEQGTIQITSPELDISGSLVSLSAALTEPIRLAADPCLYSGSAEASSLVFAGGGGVSTGPDQHAAIYYDEDRLNKVLTLDAN
jgi:hypothetical protein